jgi:phospholipase C
VKFILMIVAVLFSGCGPAAATFTFNSPETMVFTQPAMLPAPCSGGDCPNITAPPSPANDKIPVFSHVILIVLENHEFTDVVGNTQAMPEFNRWINQYTLLTNYYAVAHPSLPNYLALIGGSTFGIHSDCNNCFLHTNSLPDEIEASGRTWKDYQEDMPSACFIGRYGEKYTQAINPFVYFDSIRHNPDRCDLNVLPLAQLKQDLSKGILPDFVFITPNLCNSAHSCDLNKADQWLAGIVNELINSNLYDQNSLIAITFDEGSTDDSCCNLGSRAGGRVATLLISPLVKNGFEDETPYTHYSLLKTIETSWGLPLLGYTAKAQTSTIVSPWVK